MNKLCALLLAPLCLLLSIRPSFADEAVAPSPMRGVEWTKIQDLNPEGKAVNKPIKQKWAVVIGASKFKEKRLNVSEVAMDAAAKEFYDYLVDPHGGRFQPSHVKLLLNGGATKQNIMSSLTGPWLGSLAGPDDLVLVFIATNGFPTTDGSTYLCAYDCALDNVYSTCISMQDLMTSLKHNVHSDRILLVLQSCYSGAAELTSGAKAIYSGYNIDLEKVALGKGFMILSSSRPDQMTWSDAFSRNLVKALREQDGLIPLKDAFALAQKKTESDTSKAATGKKQTPQMKTDWTGNELILGTPPIDQVSEIPTEVKSFLAAESYYLKATNLLNAGDLDGAAKQYEAAIQTDAKYADALADYGALKTIQGDWPKAAEFYQRAIAVKPNDALFHANYARVLMKLARPEDSRKELDLSYTLNPKDRIVLTALSTKCLESGDSPQAVKLLQEATQLFPASENMHERLSYALIKAGNVDDAINEAKQAVHIDPNSTSANLNLGSTLLMSGDKKGAIAAYQQAAALSPDNIDAHYLLSKALESARDKQKAAHELSEFLRLCAPDDPRAAKAREHLSNLGAPGTKTD